MLSELAEPAFVPGDPDIALQGRMQTKRSEDALRPFQFCAQRLFRGRGNATQFPRFTSGQSVSVLYCNGKAILKFSYACAGSSGWLDRPSP